MTLGLWLIGIRHAVVLGPLSGIANMVPYLGVVVGLVPAFFLALWQGGLSWTGLYLCGAILGLFLVLQLLDGYVFQPRILGPSVGLHPLAIMLALALGEHLMGLAGMMLAVPVAAVLRVVLEELHPLLYDPAPAAP
jgi:predicted PurR-regulated permease PerM